MFVYVCIRMYVCTDVCMNICIHIDTYVCMYIQRIHDRPVSIYIYIHMYIIDVIYKYYLVPGLQAATLTDLIPCRSKMGLSMNICTHIHVYIYITYILYIYDPVLRLQTAI